MYIALFTTGTLTDASTGDVPLAVEVPTAGTGYARFPVPNDGTRWNSAVPGAPSQKTNSTQLIFPPATTDWGAVTQWAICDAVTDGNVLYYGAVPIPKLVQAGDAPTVAPGAIVITED